MSHLIARDAVAPSRSPACCSPGRFRACGAALLLGLSAGCAVVSPSDDSDWLSIQHTAVDERLPYARERQQRAFGYALLHWMQAVVGFSVGLGLVTRGVDHDSAGSIVLGAVLGVGLGGTGVWQGFERTRTANRWQRVCDDLELLKRTGGSDDRRRNPAPAPEDARPREPGTEGSGARPGVPPALPAPAEVLYCDKCGAVLAAADRFCAECGGRRP